MKISVNGEQAEIVTEKNIAELVRRYQLPPQTVFIEHNGIALHRHEWATKSLGEGDRVEIIRVIAGG